MENDPTASVVPDKNKPITRGGISEQLAKEVVNTDQALAAYFLIALAVLNSLPFLFLPGDNIAVYISTAIDLFIGSCIAMGLYSFVIWLKIRLVGGIVLGAILATLGGQTVIGMATIIYAGGLSLLVFGEVSKPRRIFAIVIMGVLTLFSIIGAVVTFMGVQ